MAGSTGWQKSSFSGGGDGNNCVELAVTGEVVRLRESDAPDAELSTTLAPLGLLIQGLKAGRFGGAGVFR